SAVNDLMVRSEGTLAEGVDDPPVVSPPQAVTKSPTNAMAGNNLANFMRVPHRCNFPPPSSRTSPGARVRRQRVLLRFPLLARALCCPAGLGVKLDDFMNFRPEEAV